MSPSPRASTHSSPPLNAYATSTQHRYWQWSAADLQQHRSSARDKAVTLLKQYLLSDAAANHNNANDEQKDDTEPTAPNGTSLQTPTAGKRTSEGDSTQASTGMTPAVDGMQIQSKTNNEITIDDLIITPDDEDKLILYYAQSIPLFSGMMQFPAYLTHTTHIFYQRYYCKISAMSAYHPKHVMIGCFFLAGKAEDYWIRPELLGDKTKTPVLHFVVHYSMSLEPSLAMSPTTHSMV